MKSIFSLMVVFAVFATPAVSTAQDFPTIGSVTSANQRIYHSPYNSVYTPGTNNLSVAPNGAVHAYYAPGHPTFSNDRGPTFFTPGFPSYYQAPGSLHYYYGVYTRPGVNPFP